MLGGPLIEVSLVEKNNLKIFLNINFYSLLKYVPKSNLVFFFFCVCEVLLR